MDTAVAEKPAETTDEMIERKRLNAPRITRDHIDSMIDAVHYHQFPGTTTTVACLVLRNGFTTIGESACVSPENFDEEIGKKVAYEDAKRKIWALEGYALRNRLVENFARTKLATQ